MGGTVAVVGAGIAGLTAAHELVRRGAEVILFEASDQVGGKIRSSPFAGVDAIDEGADAFLARVPDAVRLAEELGLDLTHPEPVGAAVWHGRLHALPDGLLLGVPGAVLPLARSGLLSWRGKLRAAVEPLLPATSLESDSIGRYVRARFGNEVHERLVDALVGSIYAADTDEFSLAEVPQLHALATRHRSLLLGARAEQRSRAGGGDTAAPIGGAIFATPPHGVQELTDALAAAVLDGGGIIELNAPIGMIEPMDGGWAVRGRRVDAVVSATPAAAAAGTLTVAAPDAAQLLAQAHTADVVLVTLHVDGWPDRLAGRSGYLVPKPVQRWVTAVSFGSQKWAHWQPVGGGQILRVSLGRAGQPVLHLHDDDIVRHVLEDLELHLGLAVTPRSVRISRWPGAFAQYRPHHSSWVDAVEAGLPPGLFVAGASYRGIGIPACVRQGRTIGERANTFATRLSQ